MRYLTKEQRELYDFYFSVAEVHLRYALKIVIILMIFYMNIVSRNFRVIIISL